LWDLERFTKPKRESCALSWISLMEETFRARSRIDISRKKRLVCFSICLRTKYLTGLPRSLWQWSMCMTVKFCTEILSLRISFWLRKAWSNSEISVLQKFCLTQNLRPRLS
jgi:hypothetical protein